MKRTQEEIVKRIKEVQADDFFGVMIDRFLVRLDFQHAKQFCREGYTAELHAGVMVNTPISEDIIGYLGFAWDKANNCRGLSANRSIDHMRALLWLDGHNIDWMDEDYEYYGKPILVTICDLYGVDWTKLDNGKWANDETNSVQEKERELRIGKALLRSKELKDAVNQAAVK